MAGRWSWTRQIGRPLVAFAFVIAGALGAACGPAAPPAPTPAASPVPAEPAAVPPPVSNGTVLSPSAAPEPELGPAPKADARLPSQVTITVMDDAKAPVPQATVHLHDAWDAERAVYLVDAVATTDDAGVARFSRVIVGDHVVVRAERGPDVGWSRKIPVVAGGEAEYMVYVGRAWIIEGRVASGSAHAGRAVGHGDEFESAEPIAGATVVMDVPSADGDAWRHTGAVRWTVTTDASGRFAMPAVREDGEVSYIQFVASAPGCAEREFTESPRRQFDLDDLAADLADAEPPRTADVGDVPRVDVGTVLLEASRVLRGRCLSLSGKPVGGLSVEIEDSPAEARTRADGCFELLRAPSSAIQLTFTSRLGVMLALRVPAGGDADLGDLTVGFGSRITGRVLDADGKPVARAQVAAAQAGVRLWRVTGLSGEDGSFALLAPPAGDLVTYATYSEGADPRLKVWVTAPAGVRGGATGVELRAPRPATLRLTIVDAESGEPIPAGQITVRVIREETWPESEVPDRVFAMYRMMHSESIELSAAPVEIEHYVTGRARVCVTTTSGTPEYYGRTAILDFAPGRTTEQTVPVDTLDR